MYLFRHFKGPNELIMAANIQLTFKAPKL